MAPPSDEAGGAPLRGRLAADAAATADAAGRPAHHPVAHAAVAPERRRPWMDLLRLVLRYVGDRVGQVLRRLMVRKNLEEPHGADLVVDELHNENGPDAIKKSREERDDAGVVVNRDLAEESEREERKDGLVGDPDARKTVSNINVDKSTTVKKNQAWQYQNRRRRAIPFVMLGNYRVYKKQKDLYAMYCQERPSSGPRQLCHMCISKQNYFKNTFPPNDMLKHCSKRHVAGIECTQPGCRVRVFTEEERSLHIHFHHSLPAGWWDWEEYTKLDK